MEQTPAQSKLSVQLGILIVGGAVLPSEPLSITQRKNIESRAIGLTPPQITESVSLLVKCVFFSLQTPQAPERRFKCCPSANYRETLC